MKHKPSDQQIVFTKPIFLSQNSVCKELNKLNESNTSSSSESVCSAENSNITIGNSIPALDERMLNEYIEENLLTEAQKTSYDIQQDLETANFLTNDNILNNQTSMIPDVLEFDEDFLKTFESNLNRFNSANDSNNGSLITRMQQLYIFLIKHGIIFKQPDLFYFPKNRTMTAKQILNTNSKIRNFWIFILKQVIYFIEFYFKKILKSINVNFILCQCNEKIYEFKEKLSLTLYFPDEWREANISSIYKKRE